MPRLLVDTHVLVDVLEDDPQWADWSIQQMRAQAAGQNNINATKMRQIKIPVPSLAEQKRFITEIEALERAIAAAQTTLAVAPARKQSIMQRYL